MQERDEIQVQVKEERGKRISIRGVNMELASQLLASQLLMKKFSHLEILFGS